MGKQHLKRINTPKTWNISRKDRKFITRPNPGCQSMEFSIPIVVLFKDMLGIVRNTKEMKYVLKNQKVLVNGTRIYDPKFSAGLMQVIELPAEKKAYRILISSKNKLYAKETKQANVRIVRIENKTILQTGKIQLNLADGTNIILKKDMYKTGDSLLLEIPQTNIKEHLPLEPKALVYLIKGSHVGKMGVVESIKKTKIFVVIDSKKIETSKQYAYVIGKNKPVIDIK